MKFCPECAHQLGEGVTHCVKCGIPFAHPNKIDDPSQQPIITEEMRAIELKIRQLELEYDLANKGLAKGQTSTILVLLSGLTTLLASSVVLVLTSIPLLTGQQLVFIFGILSFSIIIYFAFVFGRAAKIRIEIENEKKKFEIEAGGKAK